MQQRQMRDGKVQEQRKSMCIANMGRSGIAQVNCVHVCMLPFVTVLMHV
jgi:hypothetical protein